MKTAIQTNTTSDIITLSIDGMSCGHCVQAVTKALSALPGVRVRSVAIGTAQIEADDGAAASQAVTALQATGYPARATASEATAVAKSGGGCCGGAAAAATPGVRPTGGCCG